MIKSLADLLFYSTMLQKGIKRALNRANLDKYKMGKNYSETLSLFIKTLLKSANDWRRLFEILPRRS